MKKLFVLIALVTACFSRAQAQREVTGRVTDSRDGAAVVKASVRVKNSQAGTSTDQDGRFRIQVPANGSLIFSSIGFVEQEVKVNDAVVNIILQFADASLKEVVVTG